MYSASYVYTSQDLTIARVQLPCGQNILIASANLGRIESFQVPNWSICWMSTQVTPTLFQSVMQTLGIKFGVVVKAGTTALHKIQLKGHGCCKMLSCGIYCSGHARSASLKVVLWLDSDCTIFQFTTVSERPVAIRIRAGARRNEKKIMLRRKNLMELR